MKIAVKGNREIKVQSEDHAAQLVGAGYDIKEDGKTIAVGVAKQISYAEFAKIKAERDSLVAELSAIKEEKPGSGKPPKGDA